MKWFKRILFLLLIIIVLATIGFGYIVYRAAIGLPFYETEPHIVDIPQDQQTVLLFSKTNGFVHGKAIKESEIAFAKMAEENDWFLYQTKDAGIFNEEQLNQFDVTIWNNVSGNVLTAEQRKIFKAYMINGGGFVGIHAAGDGSHAWEWYVNELIDARFSHHPIRNQLQETLVSFEQQSDKITTMPSIPNWTHTDEWYIFHDNPRANGANILYTLDGNSIDPNGVLGPLQRKKTFGMGKDHPVVWNNLVGRGRSLYSSMGHTAEAFQEANHLAMLENGIKWAGKFE